MQALTMDMNWRVSIGTQPKYNTSQILSNHFDSLLADARFNFTMPKYYFREKCIGIVRYCECIECTAFDCYECQKRIPKGQENIIYWSDDNPHYYCQDCLPKQLEAIQQIVDYGLNETHDSF